MNKNGPLPELGMDWVERSSWFVHAWSFEGARCGHWIEMTRVREEDGQGDELAIKWWHCRSQEALLIPGKREFTHKIQKGNRQKGRPTNCWVYCWNSLLRKPLVSFPNWSIALCISATYFKHFIEASGLSLASGEASWEFFYAPCGLGWLLEIPSIGILLNRVFFNLVCLVLSSYS